MSTVLERWSCPSVLITPPVIAMPFCAPQSDPPGGSVNFAMKIAGAGQWAVAIGGGIAPSTIPSLHLHVRGPFSLPGIELPRPDGPTLTINITTPHKAIYGALQDGEGASDFLTLAQLQVVHVRQPESPSPKKSRISMVSPSSQTNLASSHR